MTMKSGSCEGQTPYTMAGSAVLPEIHCQDFQNGISIRSEQNWIVLRLLIFFSTTFSIVFLPWHPWCRDFDICEFLPAKAVSTAPNFQSEGPRCPPSHPHLVYLTTFWISQIFSVQFSDGQQIINQKWSGGSDGGLTCVNRLKRKTEQISARLQAKNLNNKKVLATVIWRKQNARLMSPFSVREASVGRYKVRAVLWSYTSTAWVEVCHCCKHLSLGAQEPLLVLIMIWY